MALLVQKFGGTSVGTTERIEAVAELIIRSVQAGHKVVAVVSAMAGETNRLLGLAQQIDNRPASRELDVLAAAGEQVTIALLAMALIKRGFPAVSLLADQISIHTDNKFGKARVLRVDEQRLQTELEQGHIVVAAGFQGRDIEGNVTTLGRGGSDTSAVALAAALKADECQIFTDVDGIYTIDPRICPQARRLNTIAFQDMLELASLGAKVLHSRSVEYAGLYQVPVRVLSTFKPDGGTLMVYQEQSTMISSISGIACQQHVSFMQCSGLNSALFSQFLNRLAEQNIEADMLQQHRMDGSSFGISLVLAEQDTVPVTEIVQELMQNSALRLDHCQQNLAKLSVVGIGIKSQPELIAKTYQLFAQLNVHVWSLTQAETRLSVLISPELMEVAAARLHQCLLGTEN